MNNIYFDPLTRSWALVCGAPENSSYPQVARIDRVNSIFSSNLFSQLPAPWQELLADQEPTLAQVSNALQERREAGAHILPEPEQILAAYQLPPQRVRVLIVGQDPYPTPGHAMGLAFSSAPHVQPLPRSLKNIFTELTADTGVGFPATGDLTPWSEQGVMLLNRVLTVEAGAAGAHTKIGWEQFTAATVKGLAVHAKNTGSPLVAILWGKPAQQLREILELIPTVYSPHPSPLSARRGFFGSQPFSKANQLLAAQGAVPIDWALPSLGV